jgi:hypothetical protein
MPAVVLKRRDKPDQTPGERAAVGIYSVTNGPTPTGAADLLIPFGK